MRIFSDYVYIYFSILEFSVLSAFLYSGKTDMAVKKKTFVVYHELELDV